MPPTRSSASVTVLSTSVAVAASSPLRARYLTRGNANMQSSVDGDDSYVDNYVPQLPKQREMCTPEQKDALEQLYELTQGYPSTAQRHELAARIGKYVFDAPPQSLCVLPPPRHSAIVANLLYLRSINVKDTI